MSPGSPLPLLLLHLALSPTCQVLYSLQVQGASRGALSLLLGLEGGQEEVPQLLEEGEGGLEEEEEEGWQQLVFLSRAGSRRRVEKLGLRLTGDQEVRLARLAVYMVRVEGE